MILHNNPCHRHRLSSLWLHGPWIHHVTPLVGDCGCMTVPKDAYSCPPPQLQLGCLIQTGPSECWLPSSEMLLGIRGHCWGWGCLAVTLIMSHLGQEVCKSPRKGSACEKSSHKSPSGIGLWVSSRVCASHVSRTWVFPCPEVSLWTALAI